MTTNPDVTKKFLNVVNSQSNAALTQGVGFVKLGQVRLGQVLMLHVNFFFFFGWFQAMT